MMSVDECVINFDYEKSDLPSWLALGILCEKFYLLHGFILPGNLNLKYGKGFPDKLNQVMNDDDQEQIQKWKALYDEECEIRKRYNLPDNLVFPL